MTVRRAIVPTLLLFFFLSSVLSAQEIQISGRVINSPPGIDVNRILPQGPAPVTRITPDSLGNFMISIPASEPGFYQLWEKDGGFTVLVLHPGDKVEILLDGKKIDRPLSVNGSADSDLAMHIVGVGADLKHYRDSLEGVYQKYVNSPQRDSITAVLMTQFQQGDESLREQIRKDLAAFDGSLALLFYTDYLDVDKDIVLLDQLLSSIGAKYPKDAFYKAISAKVDKVRATAKGSLAPEISLPGPDGDTLNLSDLRGQYVLIDFWAAWCGPCRKENPNIVRIYSEYHEKGFEIFGVSLDNKEANWKAAIEADKLTWYHVSDLKGWQSSAAAAYGVTSIPSSFLIDPEGRIIAKGIRSEQLEPILKGIFGKQE